jgi:GPH family glycoside/pentoside/hexuronide:cation symporter
MEALTGMRITDIVLPAVTAALAIWVMRKYSLDEERAKEIKKQLVERRGEL